MEVCVGSKGRQRPDRQQRQYRKGSLTVEAALVLPIFIFSILIFVYFIQLMTVQEHIQETITKAGLALARTAYVYEDFVDAKDLGSFDFTLFGEEYEMDVSELAEAAAGENIIKALVKKDLDTKQINHSGILGGYRDISFYYSRILEEDYIDIVVRYYVRIPVLFFVPGDLRMIQRVRLRAWTGCQVPAVYSVVKEGTGTDETTVYITETGTVYHKDINCSHIKISIDEVAGIPYSRRNLSGGKYYPCENCCGENPSITAAYYITKYGDRYHTRKDCPALKRTVKAVPLSEVSDRSPCKRCGK